MTPYSTLIPPLLAACEAAGARILEDWQRPQTIHKKADNSPKTDTDDAAEAILLAAILAVSDIPVVAEEAFAKGKRPTITDNTFWLVDALDGTREFIANKRDFTVNIALIENGIPTLGIVHAPAHKRTWYATKGHGAFRIARGETRTIRVREFNRDAITILSGKRASAPEFLEPWIGTHVVADRQQRGSSIKFCLVADGSADIYARPGETYEWDTGAGHAILNEAGGAVLDLNTGETLAYGKADADFLNTGFIAGHPALLSGPSARVL